MKNIVLYGDSIRMGYDKYVKEALSGEADVYYPSENCRFAVYTLRYIAEWKTKGGYPDDIDLVHWNAGLWDVTEMYGEEPLTRIDAYADLILRIYKRIRFIYPSAKIVFATSTAVREEGYNKSFKRRNSVIRDYNRAAIEALKDTDCIINDLYAVTEGCPDECCSDMTHFNTPKGAELVGGKVIEVICRELGIKRTDIDTDSFELEKYTTDNIGK